MRQISLGLRVVKEKTDTNGIVMGVLNDGTPYMSARGLAQLAGVAPSVIIDLVNNWSPTSRGPRASQIARTLAEAGSTLDRLSVDAVGIRTLAVPDIACAAVLEWYAFHSPREEALDAARRMIRYSMREYIYRCVEFDPSKSVIEDHWTKFHARVLLNVIPPGWFSVLTESTGMIVELIRHGLPVDEHTVPDISVGLRWGAHWKKERLGEIYGARMKCEHRYPPDFPQSRAYIEIWVYPEPALPEFRRWLREVYFPEHLDHYLSGKVQCGKLSDGDRRAVLDAVLPPVLTSKAS